VRLQDSGNYGSGVTLTVGQFTGSGIRRTLIKFNIGSIVPGNATVLNALLKLHYYEAANNNDPWVDRFVQAHQLLKNWNEMQADRDR
jgi:hypothetical protein